ncbi:MAG TPA: site-2 protease family protein [Vicinamibacteria bacterium]|nr:site-2 protease family protein [Vicinamibacteria bacterium]
MDLSPDRIVIGLVAYVVLLFSLSFHESAHAWMALRMGDRTAHDEGRISLNPLVHIDPVGTVLLPLFQMLTGVPTLGWAKPTPVQAGNFRPGLFRKGQVYVAGAGPLSNLILAVVCTALFAIGYHTRLLTPRSDDFGTMLLITGVQLNIGLAIFNLIPIPPLDGSWVASWGLPRDLGERYDRLVEPVGGWLLLLLFIPLGRYVVGPLSGFVMQALFAIVL